MRYQNVAEPLPAELLEILQGYPDGGYLCIPRRAGHHRAWGECTRRKEGTLTRNRAAFRDYTAGLGVDELFACYFLAPKSIQRILILGRRGLLEPQSCAGAKHASAQLPFGTVFVVASARSALLQWTRKRGKIPMNRSNLLIVRVAGVMNRQAVVLHAGRILPCLLSGRLLRQKDSLAAGNWVEAEVLGGGQYRLTHILPRTSALCHPSRRGSRDALLATNVDFVLVVCVTPSLLRAFALPEWTLEAARAVGLLAGLFVNHQDWLAPEEGDVLARRLEPLRVELDSLAQGPALELLTGLLSALRGKSVAVLGGPGCGRTVLVQRLAGMQVPLRPTTAVFLSQGSDGTLWLDTPGFRGASSAVRPASNYRR